MMLILESHGEKKNRGYKSVPYSRIKAAQTDNSEFEKVVKITDRLSIKFGRSSSIKKMVVDDLIQEGRLVAWSCIHKYDPDKDSSFTTYFTTCLLHRFDKIRKRERAQKRTIDRVSESLFKTIEQTSGLIDLIPDESQEKRLVKKEDRIYLQQIIKLLNPQGQQLCLYLLKDMSLNEIAKKMKTTNSKIRSLFKRNVLFQVEQIKKMELL